MAGLPHGFSPAGTSRSTRAPLSDQAARSELRTWALLGAGSLATAGVFAVLLALSRTPGIEHVFPWPLDFFAKGLVVHVIFSLVVWFLVAFALLAGIATYDVSHGAPRFASLGPTGANLVAISFPFLLAPAFVDGSTASLNNYVPVVVDRSYYFGLTLLALGVALPAVRMLANVPGRLSQIDPLAAAASVGAVIYFIALLCVGAALWHSWGSEPTRVFHEHLFWGGGHVLQFLYALLMITGWYHLVRACLGRDALDRDIFRIAVLLLGAFTLAAPVFYLAFPAFSLLQTEAFRRLQFVLALPSLMIAVGGLAAVLDGRRRGKLPWDDPAFLALVLSPIVFGAGGIMGLMVTGSDTRTPAHYHGVIAGVNLALMGMFFKHYLPAMARPIAASRIMRVQVLLFGVGQLVACIGLFLAGGYGAPRKTPSGGSSLVDGAIVGMYLHGVGALIAIIGGVLFVAVLLRALVRNETTYDETTHGAEPARRDYLAGALG
jgi:heme/copper-type cytochrome/quinol oxidase subunit 1